MIKLKNLWKIALTTMAMSAMLVACDTDSGGSSTEEVDSSIYVSGLFNKWAADTGAGDAFKMTQNGNVYTYEFTTDATDDYTTVNPYGFKFTTSNGWMEQYVNAKMGAENVSNKIDFGPEYDVKKSTKADLEAKDADGNSLISDNSTKFYFKYDVVANQKYTLTLNLDTMKVKFDGQKGEELKNYTVNDINSVKGSVTGLTWPQIDLTSSNSFEFTYDSASMTEVRFIYTVKKADGSDAGKNYKVQGSECTALGTDVAIKDDEGDDDYCKFKTSLFTDGTTYVVTLNKSNSTCKITAK